MPSSNSTLSRRALLATGATAVLTATAGCTAVFDFVGEQFLEDVNVFNETRKRIEGVRGDRPGNAAFYADVWADSGDYNVKVTLTDPIEGVSEATETVTIGKPDEEMLAIPLGADNLDAPIGFRAETGFSDFSTES